MKNFFLKRKLNIFLCASISILTALILLLCVSYAWLIKAENLEGIVSFSSGIKFNITSATAESVNQNTATFNLYKNDNGTYTALSDEDFNVNVGESFKVVSPKITPNENLTGFVIRAKFEFKGIKYIYSFDDNGNYILDQNNKPVRTSQEEDISASDVYSAVPSFNTQFKNSGDWWYFCKATSSSLASESDLQVVSNGTLPAGVLLFASESDNLFTIDAALDNVEYEKITIKLVVDVCQSAHGAPSASWGI